MRLARGKKIHRYNQVLEINVQKSPKNFLLTLSISSSTTFGSRNLSTSTL